MGRAAASAAPSVGSAIAAGATGVGAAIKGMGSGLGEAAAGAGLYAGHYLRGQAHAIALAAWQQGVRMSQLAQTYIQEHPKLSNEDKTQLLEDAQHEDKLLQLEDEKLPVVGPSTDLLQPVSSKPRRQSSPPPKPVEPKPERNLKEGITHRLGRNGKDYYFRSGKFVKHADAFEP
jgi:hypothetical protein